MTPPRALSAVWNSFHTLAPTARGRWNGRAAGALRRSPDRAPTPPRRNGSTPSCLRNNTQSLPRPRHQQREEAYAGHQSISFKNSGRPRSGLLALALEGPGPQGRRHQIPTTAWTCRARHQQTQRAGPRRGRLGRDDAAIFWRGKIEAWIYSPGFRRTSCWWRAAKPHLPAARGFALRDILEAPCSRGAGRGHLRPGQPAAPAAFDGNSVEELKRVADAGPARAGRAGLRPVLTGRPTRP